MMLIGVTAIGTYMLLIVPSRQRASQGPPPEFLEAATRQAEIGEVATPEYDATAVYSGDNFADTDYEILPTVTGTRQVRGANAPAILPTVNPFGDWPLPDYVDRSYWLSIPGLNLETPVIGLTPRRFDSGVTRLPVPNSFSVAWDATSSQPGIPGNTIITGHNNFYGGVFGDLQYIAIGSEVAVWTEVGVMSYTVQSATLIEEDSLSLSERAENARQWLADTPNDTLTLITCGPGKEDSHRFIVVATR